MNWSLIHKRFHGTMVPTMSSACVVAFYIVLFSELARWITNCMMSQLTVTSMVADLQIASPDLAGFEEVVPDWIKALSLFKFSLFFLIQMASKTFLWKFMILGLFPQNLALSQSIWWVLLLLIICWFKTSSHGCFNVFQSVVMSSIVLRLKPSKNRGRQS